MDWNVISPKKLFSPEKGGRQQLSVLREHSAEHIIIKTEPEVEVEDAEESKVEPETSELTNELTTEENE